MSLFDTEMDTAPFRKPQRPRPSIDRGSNPESQGLFADQTPAGELTVFRAQLLGTEQTAWPQLFEGFRTLKAITFSSSLEFLVRFVPLFEEAEIVFGSEHILSKAHVALAQASQVIESYGFVDALADHKALTEGLGRYLGEHGQTLLGRVLEGSLRFRLLRKRPSHEKLYLLSGETGSRVITGSADGMKWDLYPQNLMSEYGEHKKAGARRPFLEAQAGSLDTGSGANSSTEAERSVVPC